MGTRSICVRIAPRLIRKRAPCIITIVHPSFGITLFVHTALITLQRIVIIGQAFIQMAFRRNRMLAPIVLKAVFREVDLEVPSVRQQVPIVQADLGVRPLLGILRLDTPQVLKISIIGWLVI